MLFFSYAFVIILQLPGFVYACYVASTFSEEDDSCKCPPDQCQIQSHFLTLSNLLDNNPLQRSGMFMHAFHSFCFMFILVNFIGEFHHPSKPSKLLF